MARTQEKVVMVMEVPVVTVGVRDISSLPPLEVTLNLLSCSKCKDISFGTYFYCDSDDCKGLICDDCLNGPKKVDQLCPCGAKWGEKTCQLAMNMIAMLQFKCPKCDEEFLGSAFEQHLNSCEIGQGDSAENPGNVNGNGEEAGENSGQ